MREGAGSGRDAVQTDRGSSNYGKIPLSPSLGDMKPDQPVKTDQDGWKSNSAVACPEEHGCFQSLPTLKCHIRHFD